MFGLITLHQLIIVVLAGAIAVVVVAYLMNLRERVVDRRRFIGEAGAIWERCNFTKVPKVMRAIAAGDHEEARQLIEEICKEYIYASDKDEVVLGWLWPNLALYQLPKRLNPKRALFASEVTAIAKALLDCPEARAEVERQLAERKAGAK